MILHRVVGLCTLYTAVMNSSESELSNPRNAIDHSKAVQWLEAEVAEDESCADVDVGRVSAESGRGRDAERETLTRQRSRLVLLRDQWFIRGVSRKASTRGEDNVLLVRRDTPCSVAGRAFIQRHRRADDVSYVAADCCRWKSSFVARRLDILDIRVS